MNPINDIAKVLNNNFGRLKDRVFTPADLILLESENIPPPFATVTSPITRVENLNSGCLKLNSTIHINIFEKIEKSLIPINCIEQARYNNKQKWTDYIKKNKHDINEDVLRNSPMVMWDSSDYIISYFIDIIFILFNKLPQLEISMINTQSALTNIGLQNSIEFDILYTIENDKLPKQIKITDFDITLIDGCPPICCYDNMIDNERER